jgi:hypothetical protein
MTTILDEEIGSLSQCIESFWCITKEGTDDRLIADEAIRAIKHLTELLSAGNPEPGAGAKIDTEEAKLVAFFNEPAAYSRWGWEGDKLLLSSAETAIRALRSALATPSTGAVGEPVAWEYEFFGGNDIAPRWTRCVGLDDPRHTWGDTLVRNVRPLYAAAPPSSPSERDAALAHELREASKPLGGVPLYARQLTVKAAEQLERTP